MSEQDSVSDTIAYDTDESEPIETLHIHYVCNTAMHEGVDSTHDEDDLSKEENVTGVEAYKANAEQDIGKDNQLLTTHFQAEMKKPKS